mgnify:CR=1 FL=1
MRDIWGASHTPPMPLALVVDDEPNIRALIEVTLQMEGFETVSVADGISALELAATRRPDVITLDVMMPGMDGWEVLQRLRTNPKTSDLNIIVCSIFNDPELAYSLGARLLLPKPLNSVRFFEALREIGVL